MREAHFEEGRPAFQILTWECGNVFPRLFAYPQTHRVVPLAVLASVVIAVLVGFGGGFGAGWFSGYHKAKDRYQAEALVALQPQVRSCPVTAFDTPCGHVVVVS